ncbi:MAG: SNF2-related protein [Chitinispirillaceae bacterium]
MALFSEDDIRKYAFPAVVEGGKRQFKRKRVTSMHFEGDDIITSVRDNGTHRVVVSNNGRGSIRFDCSCGFSFGGACEHVVASMYAANADSAIQIGIDFDALAEQQDEGEDYDDEWYSEQEDESLSEKSAQENDDDGYDMGEPQEDPSKVVELDPGKPTGRIYLTERDTMLLAELRFSYHKGLAEFSRSDLNLSRLVPSEDGTVYRVTRSRARETMMTASLASYDLMQYQTGVFTPSDDSRIWTLQELPRLARDGFEIFGQENLRTSNARNVAPNLNVSVSSKEGLFDCSVEVSFDGISATLASLVQAVRNGSRFVLLSDGSSGILPQGWLEKFAALFSAIDAEGSGGSLSIRSSQFALADMLYDMADEKEGDPEFMSRKEALNSFRSVEKRKVPEGFLAQMRPYQLAGYEWFYFLKTYRFGGCLADDMGLGKTVQTIALLLNEKKLDEDRPSLVVVPTSLIFNWQREIEKFAPELSVLVFHGQGRARYKEIMHMSDVVISSYGTVMRDVEFLKAKRFHYIILDEAQAIKNPASQVSRSIRQLQSNHKLALSGTPIENGLSELWSMFSFLNPGMLGSFRTFAKNFIKPIERDLSDNTSAVLRKLIFPFILRRTKQQVAKDLPPKNEMVLYAEMLPKQKTLYEITRDTYRGKIIDAIDKEGVEGSRMQILEGLLRLRQICCHPAMVDETFAGDSGKFRLLEQSLVDIVSEGHRVLVFSQFVKALELVRGRIAQQGIQSEMLTGGTRDRGAVVDRFQNKRSAPVFLISLKAGGTGLNLTSADYVIHLDPWWNPSAENQASDRAYRIGQTRTVFVYKVITKDSIEERVLALQDQKKQLVQSVIQTESSFFKQLNRDDVLGLLD